MRASAPNVLVTRFVAFVSELWGLTDLSAAARTAAAAWSWQLPLRAALALALVASLLLAALRLTHFLLPRAGLALRWGTIGSSGLWLASVGFHLLRSLHLFGVIGALLACSALTALSWRLLPQRVPLGACLMREARAARALLGWLRRDARPLLGFFTVAFGVLALRALIVPPLGWDTLTYHGPRAARFLQSGQLTFEPGTGPHDYYRHFFAGGEVLTAWAMLPFHSDLLVNLGAVCQWLLLGLASWALARELGAREPFAGSAALAVMFAPVVQLQVCSGYVELPLNAALVQGCALGVRCLRRPSPGAAVACAMSLGVAAGIKLQGAAPGAIVGVFVLGRLLLARGWLAAVSGSACALLPALPFALRAWRDTGYPLSPMPIQLGPLTLGVASPMMRWYQERNLGDPGWDAEKSALLRMLAPLGDFHATLGSLSFLPFALAPLGVLALARRRPLTAAMMGAAAAVPLLAHFSASLSAVRLLRVGSAARFLITGLALCVPLSVVLCRPGAALARAYRSLLLAYPLAYTLLALRDGQAEWELRDMLCLAIVLAWTWIFVRALWRRSPRAGLALALGAWLAGSACLQLRRDQTRFSAYRHSFAIHNSPRYWADAARKLDTPDKPRRIAITGGPDQSSDKWLGYFFLGSRLQNTLHYVVPTRDGRVAHHGPGGELEARADYDAWLLRLRAAGISHVVSFQPRALELGWMQAHPDRFENVSSGPDWGVFALR